MEHLTANVTTGRRKVTKNGRDYIVAPMTMIVPGVLSGSKGSLFYPLDEIRKDPVAWNHVPIVVHHPTQNGIHVSAKDPDIWETQGIGHVYNAQANGSLKAEGWFDVELTRRVDPLVLKALEDGKPLELSTGLFTDNETAPPGSSYNGKSYDFVARNYRPDHLAILPNETGACSLEDGCGVLNAAAGANQTRCKNSGKFLQAGSGTGKGPAHDAAVSGHMPLKLCEEDRMLGADAEFQKYVLGDNPPNWSVDEGLWEKAKKEADKSGFDENVYWAVVAHLYKKLGGVIEGTGEGSNSENVSQNNSTKTNNRRSSMTKTEAITFITANCDCWKGEGDANILAKFDDKKLATLVKHVQNEQKLAANAKNCSAKNACKNQDGEEVPEEEDKGIAASDITAMEDELKQKKEDFIAQQSELEKTAEEEAAAAADEGATEETVPPVAQKGVKNRVRNQRQTMDQLLANASPEDREIWENAKEINRQTRARLIQRLTANVKDANQKKALASIYNGMPLKQLNVIAAAVPAPEKTTLRKEQPEPMYLGLSVPNPTTNAGYEEDKLELPTINWAEEVKNRKR